MKIKNSLGVNIVGILTNESYLPSRSAGNHIQEVLERNNINIKKLNIADIISGKVGCDTVFNVYYGEIGDSGLISGILEKNGINYIGNSQYACSLMWNKIITKKILIINGYKTPKYWYDADSSKTEEEFRSQIEINVKYPMVFKPVCGAVSENIIIVENRDNLIRTLKENIHLINSGFYFIEEFIKGVEISAGYVNVLNNLLPIVQISLKGRHIQSNEVKFTPGLKENIIPARLSHHVYKRIQNIAKELNLLFLANTFSRTDMIYSTERDEIYILEINSNPGLLEKSLLPLLVKESGIDHDDFFLKLLSNSLENNNVQAREHN